MGGGVYVRAYTGVCASVREHVCVRVNGLHSVCLCQRACLFSARACVRACVSFLARACVSEHMRVRLRFASAGAYARVCARVHVLRP